MERRSMIQLAAILAVAPMLLAATPVPEYFFREDHLTGSFYLHLDTRGAYRLQAREHMGIFLFDEGTWSQKDTTLTFHSRDPKKKSFRATLAEGGNERFLVWLDEQAPGRKASSAEVVRQLEAAAPQKPPYVFFEISMTTFGADLCGTYPFKFHPEMNQPPCTPKE